MKQLSILAAFCCLVVSNFSSAAPPANEQLQQKQKFVPFEVIVKFKNDTNMATLKSQMTDVELKSPSRHFSVAKINVPSPKLYRQDEAEIETLALLSRMKQRKDVAYAQLNYLFDLSFTPNDPLYPQQWHYPLISLPNAWNLTRGSSAIKIAILDSGRSGHPELSGRFSSVEYNAPAPGTPATDNGTYRHGTHVAAIAGGASNNGVGGAGVCQGCQLLNAKIFDTTTNANLNIQLSRIVASIDWAVDNGANVMNMSFENAQACTQTNMPALRGAIARAIDNGVTMVAAAGNGMANVDNVSPASCPGVISVAATDRDNNLAPYSSRGPNIGIAAPGGRTHYGASVSSTSGVSSCPADAFAGFNQNDFEGAVSAYTTSPGAGNVHCYRHLGGTSMAAPHVAGTVGLMLSMNAGLRPDQVRSVIGNTASALPGCGSDCGPGLLNAYAAVDNARIISTGPCSADNGTTKLGCNIDSIGQYVNTNGNLVESIFAYGYLWQLDASGNQVTRTKKLRAIPRYATGPCAYTPAGQECTIDSVTTLNYPGAGYVESLTAYGRFWNFDQTGNAYAGSGALLSDVARYADGPCSYAGSAPCRFDTRNLIDAPAWGGLFESITAYGRYWIFDRSGNVTGTNTLVSVDRYRTGPCAYAPAGQACTFGSRELRLSGSGHIETITAYGRYFEWGTNGQPTINHGVLLKNIARLR